MTIIQPGVDYGTFIEASSCPQRTYRWRGSRLFARVCVGVSVRGGCWHWQICSWIKALCRTKRRHNAPCHCIHDLIYLRRCNTQQGRNNSVDSPLRIQAYSRGTSVERRDRSCPIRSLRILQLVASKRVGVSNWSQTDFANIECLDYCAKYMAPDTLRLRTLTERPASFSVSNHYAGLIRPGKYFTSRESRPSCIILSHD